MKKPQFFSNSPSVTERTGHRHSLMSWRSIFAGLAVALLSYIVLISLGAGVFGTSILNTMQDGHVGTGFAVGAAVWIGISVLLSLAAGGYFAARMSMFMTPNIGSAHGLVIAALFFGLMTWGAGMTIGFAGQGLGNIVGQVGQNVGNLATHTIVTHSIENALGDTPLRTDVETVVQGVLARLLVGNTDSARTYLSRQTGLSEAELNARFAQLEAEFKAAVQTAGTRTAEVVSSGAWSIFWFLIVGVAAATVGGTYGARANLKKPIVDKSHREHFDEPTHSKVS